MIVDPNGVPYKLKPEAELNLSDPKVIFEPTFERTPINRYILDAAQDKSALNSQVDTTRVEGVIVPLVKINSQVINANDLISIRLDGKGFLPTIEVIVNKSATYIKLGTPGMVNKITVVLVPAVDGAYNKISVDFDITSVQEYSTSYRYSGSFFLPELNKRFTQCIKHEGNRSITTYELFYELAKRAKLGYAVTDEVEKIKDTKVRLMRNQNYKECILEHLKFSGLDDKSFFNAWIDLYGYLEVCNMSWIMGLNTGPSDYAMHNENGINFLNPRVTHNNVSEPGEESPDLRLGKNTFRSINNWKLDEDPANNKIESYEWVIDNSFIKMYGTDNIYYAVDHIVRGGTNNIMSEHVVIKDETAEGQAYPDYYLCQKNKYIGTEMASTEDGNTPVLYQEKRRSAYFAKLNSKKLKVTMQDPNYALNRGIMLQVAIFEYDRNLKAEMLRNAGNTNKEGDMSDEPTLSPEDKDKYMDYDTWGVLNTSISGMYFIDGIEFTYNINDHKINQVLYLIKRGESMSYVNAASKIKVSNE